MLVVERFVDHPVEFTHFTAPSSTARSLAGLQQAGFHRARRNVESERHGHAQPSTAKAVHPGGHDFFETLAP
ncbi:MAG: hypothetical protein ACT4OE_04435 [Sphingosinicella sp.]